MIGRQVSNGRRPQRLSGMSLLPATFTRDLCIVLTLLCFALALNLTKAVRALNAADTAGPAPAVVGPVICESGEQTPSSEQYELWQAPCRTLDGTAVRVVMVD
jgi:hypothetical protein